MNNFSKDANNSSRTLYDVFKSASAVDDSSSWCKYDSVSETSGVFDFASFKSVPWHGYFANDKLKLFYCNDTLRQVKVFSAVGNNVDYHLVYLDKIIAISCISFFKDSTRSRVSAGRNYISGLIIYFNDMQQFWFVGANNRTGYNVELATIMLLDSTLMPVKQLFLGWSDPRKLQFITRQVYDESGMLIREEEIQNTLNDSLISFNSTIGSIEEYFKLNQITNKECISTNLDNNYRYLPLWRSKLKTIYDCK
jgi:hypothetical protein